MRRATWLGAVLLLSSVCAVAACVGGPGSLPDVEGSSGQNPNAVPTRTAAPTVTGSGGTGGNPGTVDPAPPKPPATTPTTNPTTTPPSTEQLGPASGVGRIQYDELPYAALGCVQTERFDANLAAKAMKVSTCKASVNDGGTSEKAVVLSDADVKALRDLIDGLKEDTAKADAGCSGYDGTKRDLELTYGTKTLFVAFEYNCSGPKPDVRVDRASFVALRAKLYTLANLDPTMRPF